VASLWAYFSNDVVDTAQALMVHDASRLIERGLVLFGEVLDSRAHEFRYNAANRGARMAFHAEPIYVLG